LAEGLQIRVAQVFKKVRRHRVIHYADDLLVRVVMVTLKKITQEITTAVLNRVLTQC